MVIKKVSMPYEIAAKHIGLPTAGATVNSCKFLHAGEPGTGALEEQQHLTADADLYILEGSIHPVDPEAQDIRFQLGIPVNWNGKLIQAGGGGLDGYVIPSIMPMTGQDPEKSALKQGYAVIGSDGGHAAEKEKPFGCHWALNKETLRNFMSEQLKKTRDTACFLLESLTERKPEKVYFYGGSNGGRECMKAIQNFPEDYDGAICFYPVLYWISKILMDCHIADTLETYGDKGVIDQETQDKIREICFGICDELDGAKDGTISDLNQAAGKSEKIEREIQKILSKEQFEVLKTIGQSMRLPFPLGYGDVTFPGYQIYEGTSLSSHLTPTPKKRETGPAIGGDDFLKCAVVGDEDYNVRYFQPEKWKTQLQEVSKQIDAYSTDLDAFFERGGKLLMVQGTSDPLVCVYGTHQYYERLMERYGKENLDMSMRYYVVPGFGHGPGGEFLLGTDMIGALDNWVEKGSAPENLTAVDWNEKTKGRTRPLCEYPAFPYYSGKGDINIACNFVKMGMSENGSKEM